MGLKTRLLHAVTPYGLLGAAHGKLDRQIERAQAASGKGRAPVQVVEVDGDDPFLDELEQLHGHAAQMALTKVTAGDPLQAYRWFIEAMTLATVMHKATGDPLWATATRSYRDLAREQERIIAKPAPKALVPVAVAPAPIPPETPVDEEREAIIAGLMDKPHKLPRQMAEQLADQHLASKRGAA
jgi:hypothetical protein